MKRFLRIGILFALTSLFITSCEDIFHNTSDLLEEIRNDLNTPEPRRIFVGGNFYHYWYGPQHSGFAALSGQGNPDHFVQTGGSGLMFGGFATAAVFDIRLTENYIYIGGNFEGYDSTETNILDPSFQGLQRYSNDGFIDPSYKPFNGAGLSHQIFAIEHLSNGELVAGGDFNTLWNGYVDLIRISSVGVANLSFPIVSSTSQIYTLDSHFSDSFILAGGVSLTTLGAGSGYNNFAGVDVSDPFNPLEIPMGAFPPATPAVTNTEIRDSASYDNILYIVGTETAMFRERVYKYIFTDTGVIEDTAFSTKLQSELSASSVDSIQTVAVNDYGNIFIGGKIYWNNPDGFYHYGILKIRSDGSIDPTFKVEIIDNYNYNAVVNTIEIQANGKLLVGGSFDTVNVYNDGTDARGIIRLSEFGNIDHEFDRYALEMGSIIYAIAIEEEPES